MMTLSISVGTGCTYNL